MNTWNFLYFAHENCAFFPQGPSNTLQLVLDGMRVGYDLETSAVHDFLHPGVDAIVLGGGKMDKNTESQTGNWVQDVLLYGM